jgi:glutaryl-CoA dehydrogenase
MKPRVLEAFGHEQYGCPGLTYVSYGLIARSRACRFRLSLDDARAVFAGDVPIYEFGKEAQKYKYLPKLEKGEWFDCFDLTEPDHGSAPGSMVTRARKVDDGFLISCNKM